MHGAIALIAGLLAFCGVAQATATQAPSAYTTYSSSETFSSADVYGQVNPHGQVTDYTFQYGTPAGLSAQTPLAAAGNGTVPIKVGTAISGLQPDTTYRYRIVATSADGTKTGALHSFKTRELPLSIQITGVPSPVTFGSPFVLEGALTGAGSHSREIVLQANIFPYTAGFQNLGNPEVTTATGAFSFPVVGLLENAQLRVQTVGAGPFVRSTTAMEEVAVSVTFHVRRTHRHGYVRLYGTVTPAEVGALVGFQLLTPGKSVNEGGTALTAGTATVSRFSRVVRLRHRGVYRALIKVSNDGAHVSNFSEPILVR
jgi:hypothetical protein